jgi:hypothetical protein
MQIENEVGRAEAKERKIFAKACSLALKDAIRGSGWRSAQGMMFREMNGWFCRVDAAVWIGRRRTTIEFRVKPMALDPLFWDICGISQNSSLPLSFRAIGSWSCRTPALSIKDIEESGLTTEIFAKRSLEWTNATSEKFNSRSTGDFLSVLRAVENVPISTHITSLCLEEKFAEARELCLAGKREGGPSSGFGRFTSTGEIDFYDMALSWLSTQSSRRVLH